jgi:hypothetical protein
VIVYHATGAHACCRAPDQRGLPACVRRNAVGRPAGCGPVALGPCLGIGLAENHHRWPQVLALPAMTHWSRPDWTGLSMGARSPPLPGSRRSPPCPAGHRHRHPANGEHVEPDRGGHGRCGLVRRRQCCRQPDRIVEEFAAISGEVSAQPQLPHLPVHHDARSSDVCTRRLHGTLASAEMGPVGFPDHRSPELDGRSVFGWERNLATADKTGSG